MENKAFTINCPCCHSTLKIDAQTGAIISHETKAKETASFDEMVKNLDRQKQTREDIFNQQFNAEKDRERILEDKFKEAMKRVDEVKNEPYQNPLDVD